GGEGLADPVVVAQLEAEGAVALVLGGAGTTEDVPLRPVPAVERGLRLVVGRRVAGQPLDPVLTVADVKFLFLEDPLDGADPRPVRALAGDLPRGARARG